MSSEKNPEPVPEVPPPTGPADDFANVQPIAEPSAPNLADATPGIDPALVLDLGVAIGYKADEIEPNDILKAAIERARNSKAAFDAKHTLDFLGVPEETLTEMFVDGGLMGQLWSAMAAPCGLRDHATIMRHAIEKVTDGGVATLALKRASVKIDTVAGKAGNIGSGLHDLLGGIAEQCCGVNPKRTSAGLVYEVTIPTGQADDVGADLEFYDDIRVAVGLERLKKPA